MPQQTNQTRWQYKSLALLAAGLIVSGVLLLLLSGFREEITQPWLATLDQRAMSVVHAWTSAGLTRVMLICTFVGSWQFLSPAVVLLILLLLFRRAQRDAAVLALSVGGSAALNMGLKLFYHRTRPDVSWALTHEHSFSFPSGHAVAAFCFYATMAYLLAQGRRCATRAILSIVALGVIFAIGLSRVYLGVHYPSDVAAGYLVGAVWVSSVILALRYLERRI